MKPLIKQFKWITFITFLLLISFVLVTLFSIGSYEQNFLVNKYLHQAIINTIILGAGVMLATSIIGVSLAIINVFYDYKFKKFIHIMTILPLSIPAYIHAYNYSVMLGYGGSFDFLDISIKNIWGAIFVFSICLYPYVYIIVRSSLKKIPNNIIESSYMIYDNFFINLYKCVLPIVAKSIFLGNVLVLAETFSDIGVVEYFNIVTVSNLIKNTFTIFNDFSSAIKIGFSFSAIMITMFLIAEVIYPDISFSTSKFKSIKAKAFTPTQYTIFYSFLTFVLGISLVIPIVQMLLWSYDTMGTLDINDIFIYFSNTFTLFFYSVIIIVILALIISHTAKYDKNSKFFTIFFNIGYILPSVLITLMFMVTLKVLSDTLGIYISTTYSLVPLILAYSIKYISIAINNIAKPMNMIHPNLSNSSIVLGKSNIETFIRVDLPLLKISIFSTIILVAIDIFKEYTLIYTLKPFNYETLATKVAMYAKDEMVQESAPYSLAITFFCIIAILLLEVGGSYVRKKQK